MNDFWRVTLLALAFCLILAVSAAAEDFTFALNSSGNGYIVTKYTGSESKVTVPDWHNQKPVTEIGEGAFQGNTSMTGVSLPSTIVRIGNSAFKGCTNLRTLSSYAASGEAPSTRLPGDANLDGVTDANDALLILKFEAGWSVTIDSSNADVDASGSVDLRDATLILQYAAGQGVTLK